MIEQEPKLRPSEGKALVNYVRPSRYRYEEKANVWDGAKLIGMSFGRQCFQYECEPGKHLFIAWLQYKSPVEADLLPNRIYYSHPILNPNILGLHLCSTSLVFWPMRQRSLGMSTLKLVSPSNKNCMTGFPWPSE